MCVCVCVCVCVCECVCVSVCAGNDEVELRAASIIACDRIVEAARARGIALSAYQLDAYLWTLAKDPAYRPLPRHANPDTVFY